MKRALIPSLKLLLTSLFLALGLGACTNLAEKSSVDPHQVEIEQWHAARDARLRAPEGWLSLVGLHWVEPGTHRIGSGADNDIVLNTGPLHLGQLRLHDDTLHFTATPESDASIDGMALTAETVLPPDSSGKLVRVSFNAGQASLQVIERGGRFGLRVRDAAAPTRTGFQGIEHFPIDAGWRYEATWQPHPAGRTLDIATVLNTIEPMPNTGTIVFERDGKTHRLEVVDEGDGSLFVIFSDRTNGRETYGAGRFVYAEPLDHGRVVLDFNKAYNPPCALNAYSTCPLPPPENRLDLAVTAGEKNYLGAH